MIKKPSVIEIGWRETVGLPELGVTSLRTKIDTGARTSAIHATQIETFEKDDVAFVSFNVSGQKTGQKIACTHRVMDKRAIKNTSGVPEHRLIIETLLVLGNRSWHVELSLADRANMGFELILGRTALRRHKLLVNPGRSFLAGEPSQNPKIRKQYQEISIA